MIPSPRTSSFALTFFALLVLSACSGGDNEPDISTGEGVSATVPLEVPATTLETTGASAEQYPTTAPEDTSGPNPDLLTVRLEGAEGVRFRGNCEFGGTNRRVEGRVPARFVVQTGGFRLTCGIRKVGQPGQLRVLLTSEGRTRSVQQVGPGAGEVFVSYDSSGQNEPDTG